MTNLRIIIEAAVVGMNTPLKATVKKMNYVQMLRNCHPSFRDMYSKKLVNEGKASLFEMREFMERV